MKRGISIFLHVAGGVLLASALNRWMNAIGDWQALALPDPLVGIPLRLSLVVVGLLEMLVAMACLYCRSHGQRAAWLAWLSMNSVLFHAGLMWIGAHVRCSGLGNPFNPLRLPPFANLFYEQWMPVLLLAGSITALVWFWIDSRRSFAARAINPGTESTLKMSCTYCGGHIAYPARGSGLNMACPHCERIITLQPRSQQSGVSIKGSPEGVASD